MANQWFKFYGGEWLSDPKRDLLTPTEQNCFLTILCYAMLLNDNGRLKNVTPEAILTKSGVTKDSVEWQKSVTLIDKFISLGMLVSRGGVLSVKNWKKRQEVRSESYERVKKWREKKSENETVTETLHRNGKNRIDKNRIDKTRVVESAPSKANKDFFNQGKTYTNLLGKYTEKIDRGLAETEFQKFVLYWTEPNKSGSKVRWEQQPTFDVERRLYTWFSRVSDRRKTANVGRGLA